MPTTLPLGTAATGANVTEAQLKTWLEDVRSALAERGDPIGDPQLLQNLSLVFSVAASALTCALKTRSGADASATDPISIGFRNVTAGAGDFNIRNVTGALSLVVSSGSTLGLGNSDSAHVYVYSLDNAGTVELAISQNYFGLSGIVSTTAEGGAGGADSATVMYSSTARSNVPFRCLGRIKAPQTTSGTWAAVPTSIELWPFDIPGSFSGRVAFTGDVSPSQITADQNDYSPSGLSSAAALRLSTDAVRNITGVAGGTDGRILLLHNVGANAIILKDESTSSSAANRFALEADITLRADQSVTLQYDSTSSRWRNLAPAANGEFRSVQVFTASGTWNKPTGLKRVKVTVVGAGGGGGGVPNLSSGQVSAAGGGGSGGTSIKIIESSALGSSETVTIGSGGAGSAGAFGGNGGASSFGAHCTASGGNGAAVGHTGGSTVGACPGGTGGGSSGGSINTVGAQGAFGIYLGPTNGGDFPAHGGKGGDSLLGGGGAGTGDAAGANAIGYGGGGGGASSFTAAAGTRAGGNGFIGIILVEEYF